MLHIRTWTGTGSFRITDMANAGKRGKRCRVLHFQGWLNSSMDRDGEAYRAHCFALDALRWAEGLDPSTDFDAARAWLLERLPVKSANEHSDAYHAADMSEFCAKWYEDEIRGVDAPRPPLMARLDGVWAASADEDGVHLSDLTDQMNEPREITHDQQPGRAYELAAKVWARLPSAKSMSEASSILTAAGCKLHSYCAMD